MCNKRAGTLIKNLFVVHVLIFEGLMCCCYVVLSLV